MIFQNRLFYILLISVLSMVVISGCSQQKNPSIVQTDSITPTSGFSSYENPIQGIKVNYPFDWSIKENIGVVAVVFLSSKSGSSDQFQENVNIIVQDISSESITLKKYTESNMDDIKKNPDASLIDSGEMTLGGSPGYKVVYSAKKSPFNLQVFQAWTIKNSKIYLISYTAEVSKYQDHLNSVIQMLNSFEILK